MIRNDVLNPIQCLSVTDSPERYISRINYAGVKYLYEKGVAQARFAEALFSTAFSAIPYVGWGLMAIGLAISLGGYSPLEQAVHRAYGQRKGINVYYKIHKSIMSLNTVRYTVSQMTKEAFYEIFQTRFLHLPYFNHSYNHNQLCPFSGQLGESISSQNSFADYGASFMVGLQFHLFSGSQNFFHIGQETL